METLIFLSIRWNAIVENLKRLINEVNSTKATVRNFNLLRASYAVEIDQQLVVLSSILERLTAVEAHTLDGPIFSAANDISLARDVLVRYKDETRTFVPISDMRADFSMIKRMFLERDFDLL